jgi:replication factor C subunit 1
MDIRNFFSKKGNKDNGSVAKKKVEIVPDEKKKPSTPQQQKHAVANRQQSRGTNDNDDDDDVILIDSPVDVKKRKGTQQNSTKSTDKKSPKAKTPPKAQREHDVFLDDTTSDDDDDFVPMKKSIANQKKQKTGQETKADHTKTNPKVESTNIVVARSSPRTRKTPPTTTTSSNPTTPSQQGSTKKKKVSAPSKVHEPLRSTTILPATISQEDIDINVLTPQCLVGITFCFTGIIPDISRDEATEMIKILGGRVTTAVSGKTTYLIIGDILEDGRPVEEGGKYIRATSPESKTILVRGKDYLYGLIQQYSDHMAQSNHGIPKTSTHPVESVTSSGTTTTSTHVAKNSTSTSHQHQNTLEPIAAVVKSANPYIQTNTTKATTVTTSNPYARKSNPYAKPSATATSTTTTIDVRNVPAVVNSSSMVTKKNNNNTPQTITTSTQLWVDKYKPKHSSEILGNQDAVRKLSTWLSSWEQTFIFGNKKVKSFSAPNGPWKAALLSGPPGIGSKSLPFLNFSFVLVFS